MPPSPINGFVDELSYRVFLADLISAADLGEYREVPPDPDYGPRMIYGGRWFEHRATGQIWRIVPPQAPFMGVWERVIRTAGQGDGPTTVPVDPSRGVKRAEPA